MLDRKINKKKDIKRLLKEKKTATDDKDRPTDKTETEGGEVLGSERHILFFMRNLCRTTRMIGEEEKRNRK